MLEVIDVIEPNKEVVAIIRGLKGTITKGDVKVLKSANVKGITPAIYKANLNNETLIICEYKGEIMDNKNFYIPNSQKTYNLRGIKQYLNCLK